MIRFNLKKNNNPKSTSYDKYFAYPHIDETVDLEGHPADILDHCDLPGVRKACPCFDAHREYALL